MKIRSPASRAKRTRALAHLKRLEMREAEHPLSPTAYGKGVSACLENSRALFDESLTLMEGGHHARAVALAILSLEELDKVKRILRLTLFVDAKDIKREWRSFRNHHPKLTSSLSFLTHGTISIVTDVIKGPKGRGKELKWLPKSPELASTLKLRCLYVSCLEDGFWSVPSKLVPRYIASAIIAVVHFLLSINTAIVLGIEMVVGGQVEGGPEIERPDLSKGATIRARKWLRWRLGKAGQRWGETELGKMMRWLNASGARSKRLSRRRRRTQARRQQR